MLLSVELCSLTFQRGDFGVANMVASGLFGDGSAAAVVVGAERPEPGPRVVATRSVLYPDSERVMGWDRAAWQRLTGIATLGSNLPALVPG